MEGSESTESARYRGAADEVRVLGSLEFGSFANAYGSRTTALLAPPETGDYTFWISSDDGSELWLGTDDKEESCRRVAGVSGWSGERDWTKQKGQESEPVRLEKGRRYFKALQKEGGGGDHMAVAWRGPGIERAVIPGEHMSLPGLAPELLAKLKETIRMDAEREKLAAQVVAMIEKGETLPVELAKRLPRAGTGPRQNDTGINVLLDQAHQTSFAILWGLKGKLNGLGLRVGTSIATLNTVLEPGRPSRIRYGFNGMEPFTWWPNPEFNVVITRQTDLNAQPYTEKERAALKAFVESGGGLLIMPWTPKDERAAAAWSMNRMVGDYGARVMAESGKIGDTSTPVLKLDGSWEVLARDGKDRPLRARRPFGKGRVMIWGSSSDFVVPKNADKATETAREQQMKRVIVWLAEGKPPVGGDPGMPGGAASTSSPSAS
ncbi:MAG: PA14 domain-containing protein [Planctomycetota bacterium]